jgi:hypothetical protein
MTSPFTDQRLQEIIEAQIAKDEKLGSQSGGSGHLGEVGYVLDGVDEPVRRGEGWEVTYRYTTIITTEFTVYPDNPPYEYGHEKTITLDDEGKIISEGERRLVSTNWEAELPSGPSATDDEAYKPPREMVQMVIDPETGRDITAEHISRRLEELEIVADRIIRRAREEAEAAPGKLREIYEAAHREIHERLGVGSIGPATAAAGPLLMDKQWELAEALGIEESERVL